MGNNVIFKSSESLKTYSLNVYIFQPSKIIFITVEYDIKISLFWGGFFALFFKMGLPPPQKKKTTGFLGYVPGCPNPDSCKQMVIIVTVIITSAVTDACYAVVILRR